MSSRCMGASESGPPPAVQQASDAIVALLRGDRPDLSFIALDLDGVPPFERRAYEAVLAIPPGSTTTYGEIAAMLGEPGAAGGGVTTKLRMLGIEGADVARQGRLFDG